MIRALATATYTRKMAKFACRKIVFSWFVDGENVGERVPDVGIGDGDDREGHNFVMSGCDCRRHRSKKHDSHCNQK
ncbi:hypothetical protein V6N13_078542 [Hibiscus sabdariffa]